MPIYEVKSPNKLRKAEIIRSENIVIKDIMGQVPVLEINDVGLHKIVQEQFDNTILKDIEKLSSQEKIAEEIIKTKFKLPEKPNFTDEFSIVNIDKPFDISLLKVPEGTLPLSEVEQEVQKAYDKGFDDGQKITISTFKAELETHQEWVRNFDKIVKELQKHYISEIKKLEDSLTHLSIMVAEHILDKEVSSSSEIVIEQTRKAIQTLDDDIIFKIHLNPEDIQILKEVKSELLADSSVLEGVDIIADQSVGRGGCILETSVGNIDARLKTQLELTGDLLYHSIKSSESDLNFKPFELDDFGKEKGNRI